MRKQIRLLLIVAFLAPAVAARQKSSGKTEGGARGRKPRNN